MTDKLAVSAEALLADSFRLAARVLASGFRPTLLLGVWRGGTPVAIAMHEYFAWRGLALEHFPVKTASYAGLDEHSGRVEIALPEALAQHLDADQRLLIVDDVFDTGLSMAALLGCLRSAAGMRYPAEVRIACPWYKPSRNRTGIKPDYHLHETGSWLVFPHELQGLDAATIRRMKPELGGIFDEMDPD